MSTHLPNRSPARERPTDRLAAIHRGRPSNANGGNYTDGRVAFLLRDMAGKWLHRHVIGAGGDIGAFILLSGCVHTMGTMPPNPEESRLTNTLPPRLGRVLSLVRVDLAPRHRQPSAVMVMVATVASLVGSLAADAALVTIGTAVFPSTEGYAHFRFSDYSKLTIIGVLIACLAWPVVTRISSAPRWLFLRQAVLVTLVLLLPDLYILVQGQPPRAVAVLMCMHLAIGVVTYNCLVHLARVGEAPR
jgi:hypothetical protein